VLIRAGINPAPTNEIGVRARHKVGVAANLQVAMDRGADEAAVAGDGDAGGEVHRVV